MTEHPRETGLPAAAMAVIAPMAIRSLKTMRHPEKDSFRGDTAIRAPSAEPSGLKELTETPIYPACGERVCTTRRSRRGSGIEMDTELYHQVTIFRDGTIVRFEYVETWPEALEAAGAG